MFELFRYPGMHHLALPVSITLLFVGTIDSGSPAFSWGADLTALGVLGWYCWYVTTRTIPKLTQEFRDESTEERTLYRDEAEKNRTLFVDEARTQREMHVRNLEKMSDSWKASMTEQLQICQQLHAKERAEDTIKHDRERQQDADVHARERAEDQAEYRDIPKMSN